MNKLKQMKKISMFLLIVCSVGFQAVAQERNLILSNGQSFINTPYVANTLEANNREDLIINCDEVDCTTLVEYILAMSLCSEQGNNMSEDEFANNLKRIRYRNGKIDGYSSRLHYISDWIDNGVKNGFLEDITAKESPLKQKLSLSYMSSNPNKYRQLANSPENLQKIKEVEKELSKKEVSWLPGDVIPVKGLPYIKNGDIIAITTNTPGLDIAHMGIAIYVQDNLCLLHASSDKGKVVVDRLALNRLLARNKNWTGIRVLRMKK